MKEKDYEDSLSDDSLKEIIGGSCLGSKMSSFDISCPYCHERPLYNYTKDDKLAPPGMILLYCKSCGQVFAFFYEDLPG